MIYLNAISKYLIVVKSLCDCVNFQLPLGAYIWIEMNTRRDESRFGRSRENYDMMNQSGWLKHAHAWEVGSGKESS